MTSMLFFRALVAFLVLPGMVAGVLPWLIVRGDPSRRGGARIGWVVAGLGVCLLLWCVRDFYVAGKGTLAPWDPPKALVTIGLYAFMRNPMYVAVLMTLVGWVLASGSSRLAWYAVAIAIMFHLRVVYFEEPWLAREFSSAWTDYAANVSRWLPRATPWRPR